MKSILSALIAFGVLTLVSCNKNDNPIPAITPTVVNTTVTSGTWKITYYWNSGHDETSSFTGYIFTFGNSNVLNAIKSGTTVPGTWSAGTDDSKTKLILGFAAPSSFAQLTDDWEVIERTDTKIGLQDVSGGGSGTDFLTFEKNY